MSGPDSWLYSEVAKGEIDRAVRLEGPGAEHRYLPLADAAGAWVGLMDFHLVATARGPQWCGGAVLWSGPDALHSLVSKDPLTVSPSLLHPVCGSHGFIHGGRWVDA